MRTVGSLVKVTFPQFDNLEMRAKVDTGAYSGSLFCDEMFIKEENGIQHLYFKIHGTDKHYSTNRFRVLIVRSSNGTEEQRFSILTDIVIKKEAYRIRITLANRSHMKYPVLIGRRFLKRHEFIVDPAGVLKK